MDNQGCTFLSVSTTTVPTRAYAEIAVQLYMFLYTETFNASTFSFNASTDIDVLHYPSINTLRLITNAHGLNMKLGQRPS